MLKPFPQSFWIKESLLCAGHYPGDIDEAVHLTKLNGLLDCGIRRVINLMEEGEVNYGGRPFRPYDSTLAELAALRGMPAPDCLRMPLRDAKARIRPLFTQARVAASAGLFLEHFWNEVDRFCGWIVLVI